jgi:hypothetical protein
MSWLACARQEAKMPGDARSWIAKASAAVAAVWLVAACPPSASAEEQCLKDAWKAFNREDFKAAIAAADKCIDEFGKGADREQAQLTRDNVPAPPTGTTSAEEQAAIFKRGLLNDVGTAWYVKARAAESLFRTAATRSKSKDEAAAYREMSQAAYAAACRYPHARTFDQKGFFWSPCQAARDRSL